MARSQIFNSHARIRTSILRILGIIFVSTQLFTVGTSTAHATGIPTIDAANLQQAIVTYIESAITSAQQFASTAQQFYEWGESFSLASLKGTLTQSLQDKVLGFVKGGGSGGSKIIGDWTEFLADKEEEGKRSFSDALGQTKICDQFRSDVLRSVGTQEDSYPDGDGSVSSQLDCDFEPGELQAIIDDPEKGSWDSYLKMAEPQNNRAGAFLLAKKAERETVERYVEASKAEAISGGGFLSARKDGVITTPGSIIQDLTAKAAGADFDLVANADQLKDIIGMVSGGLVSKLSNEGGLSGVDMVERRRRRNRTRDDNGNLIASDKLIPNCSQVFADSLTDEQMERFDTNGGGDFDDEPDGELSDAEVSSAILIAANEVDFSLYDLCLDTSNAQTGNTARTTDATISEVVSKRRQAQKPLKDLVASVKRTRNNLDKYPSKPTVPHHKIDITAIPGLSYSPDSTTRAETFKYAFVDRVNVRECFEITGYEIVNRTAPRKDYVRALWEPVDYVSSTTGAVFDPARDEFDPLLTRTTNPGANGKTVRCTVNLRNADGNLIESAYYEKLFDRVSTVDDANDLAVKKVNALQKMIRTAAKSSPAALRTKKTGEIIRDFECHGDPFSCFINDPENVGLTKQLGCNQSDADETLNESGYYLADEECNTAQDAQGDLIWQTVPAHKVIDAVEMTGRDFFSYDTYGEILNQIGLRSESDLEKASETAFNGLISNINQDDPTDDPSNPYYDPAFDPEEASRVFIFSQGNLDVLGSLQEPEDADEDGGVGENPDEDNGASG